MRIFYTILLLVLFQAILSSQNNGTELLVLGSCSYVPEVKGQKITLHFIVDNSSCDPLNGYISMTEKKYHFEQGLSAKGIKFSDFKRSWKSNHVKMIETEIYSFVGESKEIDKVAEVAKNQYIKIKNVQKVYEEKTLESQDENAICALNEAIRKAEVIAKDLGFENCELLYVDDDTNKYSRSSLYAALYFMPIEDLLNNAGTYNIVGYFQLY